MSNMMFPAAFLSNAPQLQTRKALLVLDLQNDFVAANGILPVKNAPEFLGRVTNLASNFRANGDVVWVQTQFEGPRPTIDAESGAYEVVLEDSLPQRFKSEEQRGERPESQSIGQSRGYSPVLAQGQQPVHEQLPDRPRECSETCASTPAQVSYLDGSKEAPTSSAASQPPSDKDAFLADSEGGFSKNCCAPGSAGCQFPDSILESIDARYDTILVKSHYSAFRATPLLMSLRMKLVTELFLCGSLSNVSVYATALDAVRHGFTITVIEDCVGFRSRAVHEECMRQMADMMGANGVTSTELIDEIAEALEGHGQDHYITSTNKTKIAVDDDLPLRPKIQDWVSQVAAYSRPEIRPSLDEPYEAVLADWHRPVATTIRNTETASRAFEMPVPATVWHGDSGESIPNTRKRSTDELDVTEFESKSAFVTKSYRAWRDSPDQDKEQSHMKVNRIRVRRNQDSNRPRKSQDTAPNPYHETQQVFHAESGTSNLQHLGDSGEDLVIIPDDASASDDLDTTVSSPTKVAKALGMRIRKGPQVVAASELGPSDTIGEGDSNIIYDFLPAETATIVFQAVKEEVQWQTMYHMSGEVPRLVACQGTIEQDGSKPLYRHPADESPVTRSFSPAVERIRLEVEKRLSQPVNHVLIQLYRNGEDNISEHSDKTLDITRGSKVVNVSLGAQRTMTLRTKKQATTGQPNVRGEESDNAVFSTEARSNTALHASETQRKSQRVAMPHNSMFLLGETTNMRWLHSIRPDKRPETQKVPQETAFGSERISLTFRNIGTFFSPDQALIWGQGAKSKSRDTAGKIVDDEKAAEKMINAFGQENHSVDFDWERHYGEGFDVVNIKIVGKAVAA